MRLLTSNRLTRTERFLAILSIFLGLLPFAIFAVEQSAGLIPAEAAWNALQMNHGPWRWEIEGFSILYPMLLLMPVTMLISIGQTLAHRSLRALGVGAILIGLQLSITWTQLSHLYWLID